MNFDFSSYRKTGVASISLLMLSIAPFQSATAEPSPLFWFQGVDLGYGRTGAWRAPEQPRDGTQFNLKTMASYYTQPKPIVSDIGLGWEWGRRSGYYSDNSYVKSFARGFYLEAQSRWIFSPSPLLRSVPSYQVGPLLLYNLNGDVGLGNGTFSADQEKQALYLGVQALYEFPMKNEWVHRVGFKLATAINIDNRSAVLAQLTYQVGFPVLGYLFRDPKAKVLPIVHYDRPLKRFRLVLDGRNIEFDLNQSTLRPDSYARIQSVGRFLKANQDKWEKLTISGHTDERGSYAYNQKLSENRANTVRKALLSTGIAENRIVSRGFSESRPLVNEHNEEAWQKNRRVEFDFTGVSGVDVLSRGLFDSTTVEGRELDDSIR